MFKWVVGVPLALGLLLAGGASATPSSSRSVGAVLQVRRLLGTERGCAGWKSEPPGDRSAVVRVEGQPGECYRVGVADVSLKGLSARAVDESLLGLWVVKVTMNEAQSAAFNRMAARDYHKVVACVVEGAAIFDGTMIAKQFGGSFQMSNFTEQSARRIARELDPA